MRHSRTCFVPRHPQPVPATDRAVIARALNALAARRLADPTRLAPGPDYPAAIPV